MGWEQRISKSRGVAYYYNAETGESVWEKPDGFDVQSRVRVKHILVKHSGSRRPSSWRETVYSYCENPRTFKVLVAAQYSGVAVEVGDKFKFGSDNKTSEFLSKFPFGKVPAMDTPDGPLYESNALAIYVALKGKNKEKLLGSTPYESALIHQFIDIAEGEIYPSVGGWTWSMLGYEAYSESVSMKCEEDIKKNLEILDKMLVSKTFVVGEEITLADVCLVCALYYPFKMLLDESSRDVYKNVTRYFKTCISQPEFVRALGDFEFCKVRQTYDPSRFSKKEEKQEVPGNHDEEEEEEEAGKKPKAKNPLDLLPPPSFNLEAWKKFYSNNEVRPDAIDYFWANYRPEDYSMYRLNYKDNDELKLVFMSCNLIGGFFQRLESMHKYAFGSMCVFGENSSSAISGMFIIRGSELPEMFKDVPDFDSYDVVKVDASDPQVRSEWEHFLAWDGEFGGKKFASGKIFK